MLYWDPGIDGVAYKKEIINSLAAFFNNSNSGKN
jgi:hypothetical protein